MENDSVVRFAFAEYVSPLIVVLDEIAGETGMFKMILGCADCPELIEALSETDSLPDICIIGIRDGEDLFEILRHIEFMKMQWPAMGILIFTESLHEYFINQFINSGANGILNKRNSSLEDLLEAMNNILVSGFHYSSLANQDQFQAVHDKKINVLPLTKNQINLIRYSCAGKTYKEIATDLRVGYMAVYMAYKRLRKKLNLHERFGFDQFGFHAGIMPDISYEQFRAKMDFLNHL